MQNLPLLSATVFLGKGKMCSNMFYMAEVIEWSYATAGLNIYRYKRDSKSLKTLKWLTELLKLVKV